MVSDTAAYKMKMKIHTDRLPPIVSEPADMKEVTADRDYDNCQNYK